MAQRPDPSLLRLIPRDWRSTLQRALLREQLQHNVPVFELFREPTDLDELFRNTPERFAIWRENGTVIFVGSRSFEPLRRQDVFFTVRHGDNNESECEIYGQTDDAIVETVVFFFTLKKGASVETQLRYLPYGVDFAALRPKQLARFLDASQKVLLRFRGGIFTKEQSTILASRPYPLDLDLGNMRFIDGGTAFVDALEKRQLFFGSLDVTYKDSHTEPFSAEKLRRLCNLKIIDKLCVRDFDGMGKESALLPFSARVNSLEYTIPTTHIEPEEFTSLDIVTKDLTFIMQPSNTYWDDHLISFFARVAELGHFERLTVGSTYDEINSTSDVTPIAEALTRAISANPHLTYLDLYETFPLADWGTQLDFIFKSMEKHKNLREFVVPGRYYWDIDESDNGFDYAALERLLYRNRNITVLDYRGNRFSNGSRIDKLYALNEFYRGSEILVKESTAVRPSLVTRALVGSASTSFQYTALLLSFHKDMLCDELIHGANMEEDPISPVSIPRRSNRAHRSKRTSKTQSRRAAKKAASDEK